MHNILRRRKNLITLLFILSYLQLSPLLAQLHYAPYIFKGSNKANMETWISKSYNSLSDDERLAQLIMPIVFPSKNKQKISHQEQKVRKYQWGGILYQKGLLQEQVRMNSRLQEVAKVPLLIALDGEWGLHMRLKDAPRYPRNLGLGLQDDRQIIYNYGRELARQCRLMGIHVNFAPDVDVNINPHNPVIGTRSFGDKPEIVEACALAYAQGLEDGGVLSVAKHFPGHGDTNQDSHKTLPSLGASKKRMQAVELVPFKAYIDKGFGGIMTAHLKVAAYEKEQIPSSLSYDICTALLQEEMNFKGLIFTDGLEMQGVLANGSRDIGLKAILAGNDILLGPKDPIHTLQELKHALQDGRLPYSLVEEKVKKILAYKWRLIIAQEDLKVGESQIKEAIWTKAAKDFQQKLWHKSLHFVKEDKGLWQALEQGRIKRIAVINAGKRYARPSYAPRKALANTPIHYINWSKLGRNKTRALTKYDLILLNIFSKNAISQASINALSKRHKVIIAYYHSPFQLDKKVLKRSKANTLILAIEGTREAQTEVLKLLTKEQQTDTEPELKSDANDDSDPTANMTQEESEPLSTTQANSLNKADFMQLDALVQDGLDRGAFPGCQLFVSQNGKLLYSKAYGSYTNSKDSPAIDRSSIYDLASITKALATTPALMLLVDRKQVNINRHLSYYLPRFIGTEVGNVSLKELLFHEAGLPAGIAFPVGLFEPDLNVREWARLAKDWQDSRYIDISSSQYISKEPSIESLPFARKLYISKNYKEVMLNKIAGLKLKRRGRYRYSDLSFVLLQQVIEQVAGESLESFLQKNIYEPIGAKVYFNPLDKGIALSQIVPAQHDKILRKQIIRGTVDDETAACLGGVSGNAGLFASAEELAKVCQLLLNGGRWGNKQIISRKVVNYFCQTKSRKSKRALGFDAPRPRVRNTAKAMSQNSIGHLGFTGTAFWIDRDKKLIYIFLSNRTYPSRKNKLLQKKNYRPRLLQEVYDILN